MTIGTQFLFRGLALVLVGGRQYPLVDTQDSPAYERDGRQAVRRSRWSSTGSSSPRSAPGCCSTGTASARTPTSPVTTPRPPRSWASRSGGRGSCSSSSSASRRHSPGSSTASRSSTTTHRSGDGYLLPALAAVFVGGTSVFGGRGSVLGTVLGAFMIGGIQAGSRRHRPERLLPQPRVRRGHPGLRLDPRRAPTTVRVLMGRTTNGGRHRPISRPTHAACARPAEPAVAPGRRR